MNEQNEKQAIEEMASVLEQAKIDALATIGSMNHGFGTWYAKACYTAGYRKQRDGEWIIKKVGYYQRLVCSVCEKLSIATFDYCPNCGAKMKGGAE